MTHNSEDIDSPPILITSRLEESHPGKDLTHSYRMCRLFGLSPDQKSFMFKMVQNLLPTRERLNRLGKVASPSCLFCDSPEDTLEHLIVCPNSSEATTPLLACLSSQVSNLTSTDVTTMNINTSESWELPAAWLVATSLTFVWEDRAAGKSTSLSRLRARVAFLSSTKQCGALK